MGEINKPRLARRLGLLTLSATGICSMLGASINVVPFMIHRSVEGIGPYVLPAFIFAMVPALFAAFAYGILSSAMPRAGGSYLYASRGLNPYLGFIASFSQWFGLSIVIGVIAYICIPFIRDVAMGLGFLNLSNSLEEPIIRVGLALFLIWLFVMININGTKSYENTLLPMMVLMFLLGGIVILFGFIYEHSDFIKAYQLSENRQIEINSQTNFEWRTFLSAAAILFASFIGFDSIAQAGSEAKNPSINLPKAILLAILTVGLFYFLYTAAVYNTIPWSFIASEAQSKDISAPGLLSYILPSWLGVAIILGAAIALINDLPAMLLSVSRLMFAWAEDGIFPSSVARVHQSKRTPHIALLLAGGMASVGVLGSHFAGDFFLGIDIMVTSMMVNFLLMCITLLSIKKTNPTLAKNINVIKNRKYQLVIGWFGTLFLILFLTIHTYKDLTSSVENWYFHSTAVWSLVMVFGSIIFLFNWYKIGKRGKNQYEHFKFLPEE